MNLINFEQKFEKTVEQLLKNCDLIQIRLFGDVCKEGEKSGKGPSFDKTIHADFMNAALETLKDCGALLNNVHNGVCANSISPSFQKKEDASPMFNTIKNVLAVIEDIGTMLRNIRCAFESVPDSESLSEPPTFTYEDLCDAVLGKMSQNLMETDSILAFINGKPCDGGR